MYHKRCKDCKYFYTYNGFDGDRKGYCTRFPKWQKIVDIHYFGGFDKSETHWCGEYVSKHNEPFECKCDECIINAPYRFCCKKECGEHEFCKGCDVRQ